MRVYIDFGKDCKKYYKNLFSKRYFHKLIEAVATNVESFRGCPLFYGDKNASEVCEKRVKKYIIHEVNKFIAKMPLEDSSINMMRHVSVKQLKRLLVLTEKKKGKKVSCYALIVLHVIFENINKENSDILDRLAKQIYDLSGEYLKEHPDMCVRDNNNYELIEFLRHCYDPVHKEIEQEKKSIIAELPKIKRKMK